MSQDLGGGGAWLWVVLGAVAVIIFVAVATTTFRSWRRLHTWTQVDATVTKVRTKKHTSRDSTTGTTTSTSKVADYRFVDASGHERSGIDDWPGKRRRGDTVRVVYDPARPDINDTASIRGLLIASIVLLLPFALGLYSLQWGLATGFGHEPLLEIQDPRLLWLDESEILAIPPTTR